MAKKKGKSVSFDAMVKFFMHNYNIPTKRDIESILARLDRIERLVAAGAPVRGRRTGPSGERAVELTASNVVLDIVRHHPEGVDFSQIKLQTGFGEKKLRNVLFRLHKLEKIRRKSRGIYTPA